MLPSVVVQTPTELKQVDAEHYRSLKAWLLFASEAKP